MTDYSAVLERDDLLYKGDNQGHSITAYADENKELNYGSVTSEIRCVNKHGEDCRVRIEAFEADAETVKPAAAKDTENHQLDMDRKHKFANTQMLAMYLIFFFVGCVLIKVWPHPGVDVAKHGSFLQGREDCVKSFEACAMDERNSTSTCTQQFLTCGSHLTNRNAGCTVDFVNCTNWANSLEGDHAAEGLDRCKAEFGRCQKYSKTSNWKTVTFVVMALTVLSYLSQSPPIFFFVLLVEVAIGIYTDSFRGYVLGNFLAGMILPCFSGMDRSRTIAQQQAQQRQMAQFQSLVQSYQRDTQV